jgi:hypothetical protein
VDILYRDDPSIYPKHQRQFNDNQLEDSDEAANLDRTSNLEQTIISTNTFGNYTDG